MSYMFNLQNNNEMDFKLRYFLNSYRLFPFTTLPYEAISVTSRIKLFENFRNQIGNDFVSSFLAGSISSIIANPFFKLSIGNHHNKLGSLKIKEFFRETFLNKNKLQFFFKIPLSVIINGGLLGFVHLYSYNRILKIIESPTRYKDEKE